MGLDMRPFDFKKIHTSKKKDAQKSYIIWLLAATTNYAYDSTQPFHTTVTHQKDSFMIHGDSYAVLTMMHVSQTPLPE